MFINLLKTQRDVFLVFTLIFFLVLLYIKQVGAVLLTIFYYIIYIQCLTIQEAL